MGIFGCPEETVTLNVLKCIGIVVLCVTNFRIFYKRWYKPHKDRWCK